MPVLRSKAEVGSNTIHLHHAVGHVEVDVKSGDPLLRGPSSVIITPNRQSFGPPLPFRNLVVPADVSVDQIQSLESCPPSNGPESDSGDSEPPGFAYESGSSLLGHKLARPLLLHFYVSNSPVESIKDGVTCRFFSTGPLQCAHALAFKHPQALIRADPTMGGSLQTIEATELELIV